MLGTVLPALGIAMLAGNIYYTFLARRLARKENRADVTALPYGPSVPHMFIVVFVIMLPIFLATGDPVRAWEAGLAWAFVIGVIVLIGAFIGPFIRKITPRAAMLGTLAGISLTFISMRPAAQIWEAAWIGLPVLGIILVGFFTNIRLPGGIPVGLAALLVGTAIGWIGGYMSVPDVQEAVGQIAIAVPTLHFDLLFTGLGNLAPLLATAIPLGVYNFAEAMSNVESAAAAGRQLQPAQRAARRRRPARSSARRSARRSRPRSTSATPAGRRPAGAAATRWPAASSSRCCASSACSGC